MTVPTSYRAALVEKAKARGYAYPIAQDMADFALDYGAELRQCSLNQAIALNAARAEVAELRKELEELRRLRAFDTGTVPLPRGLALEHVRLDEMWQQLVRERDNYKRDRDATADVVGALTTQVSRLVRERDVELADVERLKEELAKLKEGSDAWDMGFEEGWGKRDARGKGERARGAVEALGKLFDWAATMPMMTVPRIMDSIQKQLDAARAQVQPGESRPVTGLEPAKPPTTPCGGSDAPPAVSPSSAAQPAGFTPAQVEELRKHLEASAETRAAMKRQCAPVSSETLHRFISRGPAQRAPPGTELRAGLIEALQSELAEVKDTCARQLRIVDAARFLVKLYDAHWTDGPRPSVSHLRDQTAGDGWGDLLCALAALDTAPMPSAREEALEQMRKGGYDKTTHAERVALVNEQLRSRAAAEETKK